jgi:hypothetical protein
MEATSRDVVKSGWSNLIDKFGSKEYIYIKKLDELFYN